MSKVIEDMNSLEQELNQFYMEKFGRTDRNNIDIKMSNPPVMLQTLAIVKMTSVMEELVEKINLLLESKESDAKSSNDVAKKPNPKKK